RNHESERLLLTALATPQHSRRRFVRSTYGEVVATEPLDREHAAVAQQPGGRGDRLARGLDAVALEAQPRTARRTAGRLGVEAPIRRVVILGRAGFAHREP